MIIRNNDKIRIDELIDQIQWNRSSLIFLSEPIGGTNTSYFVEYEGDRYVIRIAANDPSILSINRKTEYEATEFASAIGVGATLKFFNVNTGDMITYFHPGKIPTIEDIQKPNSLHLLVKTLKRLHNGKIAHYFNPHEDIKIRLALLENKGSKILEDCIFVKAKKRYDEAIANIPHGINEKEYLGLCHNDPCVNNMIYMDKFVIIDYEFAGMGNIFFDIASICGQWTFLMKKAFLIYYFGYFESCHLDYINYYTIIQLFWNATWGYVKKFDDNTVVIDYIGWANEQCSIILNI